MPFKSCPKCSTFSGVRTLFCPECGEKFKKGNKNKNQVVINNNITINNRRNSAIDIIDDSDDDEPIYINRTPLTRIVEENDSEINLNPVGYFDHLFDREDQVNVLVSSARTAIDTNFKIRTHSILFGPPAGGKTSLTTAFINMVGDENCYRIDATTSTQAGIVEDLLNMGSRVKFLIIDEIEKCKEEYLRWLLGIMDERAELRVNNAKVGAIQMPLPAFVIATTNDITKIERIMGGALASRFTEKVYCPRVREETIHKAVKKYIDQLPNADEAWIEPAVKYVREEEGTDDIRRMIAVAVNGRERLLTGEYQAILKGTGRNSN